MDLPPGKYTLETLAKRRGITRQSALNLLTRLKRTGRVRVSGGGAQKRIYTVTQKPTVPTNGFYETVNRYGPDTLVPAFEHHVVGTYTIERAIIDGISIGDTRTLEATKHLFRHVMSWKRLFTLARERGIADEVHALYEEARRTVKVKRMPERYRR